jgi:hypothetical protein
MRHTRWVFIKRRLTQAVSKVLAMTPTDLTPAREPVTLDEQIAAVWRAHGRFMYRVVALSESSKDPALLQKVVATLQQHKRAMAVIEAVRAWVRDEGSVIEMEDRLCDALDAFDTAEPSEPKS